MKLSQIRKHLHKHPEVSEEEKETAAYINEQLQALGVKEIHSGFSENSVLAEINSGKPGNCLLFRCELDALPITESNSFSHASVNKNVSHKCGHDGHMTILLGFAEEIKRIDFKGQVLLLFQSSEETGKGAKNILESGFLDNYPIDYVFALHNIPKYPKNSIICKPNTFTASVESLDIILEGKTSHAGMPQNGVNPANCVAAIIAYFSELENQKANSNQHLLATPIQIKMGKSAYGTSAGEALVSYTLRSFDAAYFTSVKEKIKIDLKHLVQKTPGLEYKLIWKEAFEAHHNTPELYQAIKNIAAKKNLEFIEKEKPFAWGEDFGTFTQKYKGAMFGLGAGENTPELHNPDYDFPEEIIPTGIQVFLSLQKQFENDN